ncbi:MAG: 3-deoxy-7-phosphoheptulonate synthase [Calditrichaeota bacterium]|nr:3-deoxy-7-phosphoheptulonate synthase [Calditrichota bacterium]
MVIVMNRHASEDEIMNVIEFVEALGARTHLSRGQEKIVIGVIGDKRNIQKEQIKVLPGVEDVVSILKPYKLVSREFKEQDTIVRLNGVEIGGEQPVVIAGPCSVESEKQIIETARLVKAHGAQLLRGGAFKPRTSPYSFQGLGEDGLKLLKKAKEETGLYIVTEVLDAMDVPMVAEYADILQIGARNMQNYKLLKAVGKIDKPVLLKRGLSATLTEFLLSAEYILSEGNPNVILCERGIRTFVEYSRNTLDLNIVPMIKRVSHLPILVDPSHGTGRRELVIPLSLAAIVSGADGLLIEVHPQPERSWSDADQTLSPDQFALLMRKLDSLVKWLRNEESVIYTN